MLPGISLNNRQPWLRNKGTGSCIPLPLQIKSQSLVVCLMGLTVCLCRVALAAYTDEFLQAFRNLGLDPWAGMEMDVAWGHATLRTLRYGLHRPSIVGPIFVYRVSAFSPVAFPHRVQVLTHENLSPDQALSAIASHFPDLRDRWAEDTWHVAAIDSTRGHSRDRQAFLSPLVPGDLDCVEMQMWHNGNALDFALVTCVDGFFVQVIVTCGRAIRDNIVAAAPILVPQLHVDPVVLPDPQYLQVTACVPGGDTLISSRSASVADRRDRVFAVLQTVLRQRFPDMAHVGFNVVKVHPSSSMLDPILRSQKEKVVTVYTDDVLRLNAVVLLHLRFPPYDEEGAIYTLRRLRLHTLIGQLGLEVVCGQHGDNCLCYINGIELTNDIEAAVEDAAFISCWMLPLTVADEVEVVSIADSTSVHSLVTIGPAPGPSSAASCQPAAGIAAGSNMW